MIRLEWVTSTNTTLDYRLFGPDGSELQMVGWCGTAMWSNWLGDTSGEERGLEANKAACEASFRRSIRELAAWVEQEDAK